MNSRYHDLLEDGHNNAFVKLWSTHILARIKAFGWRILWNRLPTIFFLKIRGLCLNFNEELYVFSSQEEEELNHLKGVHWPFLEMVSKLV